MSNDIYKYYRAWRGFSATAEFLVRNKVQAASSHIVSKANTISVANKL